MQMTIEQFLKNTGCEEKLCELTGRVIPRAVINIRDTIQSRGGELAGSENASGEKQLALDVQSNQIVVDELRASGLVGMAASEEMEEVVILRQAQDDKKGAPFTVVFDPLDGSSLVDVNLAVGSIFGVYAGDGGLIGKTGNDQLAACFAVYGPRTTIVLTVKKGTHEFRLAKDGKFYLTKENLKIEPVAKYFAPGNLRAAAERPNYLALTNDWIKKGLTLRYSGGMVPDINHILLKGNGVFTYPGYSKAPNGKLRLLFECNPMSLLVEQAGGGATDGKGDLLAQKITGLHQRTPIFIGSKDEVKNAVSALSP